MPRVTIVTLMSILATFAVRRWMIGGMVAVGPLLDG